MPCLLLRFVPRRMPLTRANFFLLHLPLTPASSSAAGHQCLFHVDYTQLDGTHTYRHVSSSSSWQVGFPVSGAGIVTMQVY
jgi:hypothetical protein